MRTLFALFFTISFGHGFSQQHTLPAFTGCEIFRPLKKSISNYMQMAFLDRFKYYFDRSCGFMSVVASFTISPSGTVQITGFDRDTNNATKFVADVLRSTSGMWCGFSNSEEVKMKLPVYITLKECNSVNHPILIDSFPEKPSLLIPKKKRKVILIRAFVVTP